MAEQFANFAQSSLAASITAQQTAIYVADASHFPALGNFRIVVQTFDASSQTPISQPEIMLVTAVGGNGFTVQRGAESTAALAFASGAKVTHIITAAVMQALQPLLSLTTIGSSGAATLLNNILNIPQYSGGGGSIPQARFNIIG